MALSNWSELVASIATWSWRSDQTDFEAAIPDFIRLAEVDAESRLSVGEMRATANITMTDGVGSLPDDYVEFVRVYELSNSRVDLLPGREANGRGFEIVGSSIRGHPSSVGDLGIDYYRSIPLLSAENPTNWLLTKSPGVYLYGALLVAMPHDREDNRIAVWETRLERAYSLLESRDVRARYAKAGRRRDASRTP